MAKRKKLVLTDIQYKVMALQRLGFSGTHIGKLLHKDGNTILKWQKSQVYLEKYEDYVNEEFALFDDRLIFLRDAVLLQVESVLFNPKSNSNEVLKAADMMFKLIGSYT